jgi:hypothetical protein
MPARKADLVSDQDAFRGVERSIRRALVSEQHESVVTRFRTAHLILEQLHRANQPFPGLFRIALCAKSARAHGSQNFARVWVRLPRPEDQRRLQISQIRRSVDATSNGVQQERTRSLNK